MGDESASDDRSRSLRDDALSVFLIAAAVVLGVIYASDQWQTSRLEDQIAHARAIDDGFAVDGADCQVSSTGVAGETLVVSCPGLDAEEIAAAAAESDRLRQGLANFDEVVVRGADEPLVCPAAASRWPDDCHE